MTESKLQSAYYITPPKGLVRINWAELWRYRELFFIFVWRDVKVRYKQTILGVAWAIFQPIVTMVVFTVFFGRLGNIPSDNIPYPVFVYAGLLFWTYYQTALTNITGCLVENENIIKKVYFPRLVLPISTAITPMIDFAAAIIILFIIMGYYRYMPHFWGIVALPFLLLVSVVASSGLGLFLASMNVKFRDVRYLLPFFIQLLLYLTPVIYPISLIPEKYQALLFINPMTGVITVARTLLLGQGVINWEYIGISIASSVIIFILGLAYFRKTERFFADII
jgi:lipopolysaccharide transport system permease protein